jgi:hypothetical protein
MTLWHILWLLAGVGAGSLHAASLWLSVRQFGAWHAALGMLRLIVVAGVLVAAAITGGLIPACIGWGMGFVVTVTAVLVRRRSA